MVSSHAENFGGLPIREYKESKPPAKCGDAAICFRIDYDQAEKGATMSDLLGGFLSLPQAVQTRAIVIGCWENSSTQDSSPIVEVLVANRKKLPALRALFIGDILSEENEISWIVQSDMAPIFSAFPLLEEFRVRGGNGLGIGVIRHDNLKSLIIESGGLNRMVVRDVGDSQLPALEHLEIWLGTENYGADTEVTDLKDILSGHNLPSLKYLGLQDSDITDEIAVAAAAAPIVARLETLSLSMGTLSDQGAAALLASRAVKRLKKLDLHHHFVSDEMMAKFKKFGPVVDLNDQESGDEDERYVEVSE
jgi:hypothetical protein